MKWFYFAVSATIGLAGVLVISQHVPIVVNVIVSMAYGYCTTSLFLLMRKEAHDRTNL